jgi:hypothetical protein
MIYLVYQSPMPYHRSDGAKKDAESAKRRDTRSL